MEKLGVNKEMCQKVARLVKEVLLIDWYDLMDKWETPCVMVMI